MIKIDIVTITPGQVPNKKSPIRSNMSALLHSFHDSQEPVLLEHTLELNIGVILATSFTASNQHIYLLFQCQYKYCSREPNYCQILPEDWLNCR